MAITKFIKRRQFDRFSIKDGTVSVIKEHYTKMGQLMDISKGGLSFRYVDSGNGEDEFPEKSELSIVLSHNGFHLERLPFITISDYELKPDFMEMRQRSVRFKRVPQDQYSHLEYLLSNLTTGAIEDNRCELDRRHFDLQPETIENSNYNDATIVKDQERRSGNERRMLQLETASWKLGY